MARVGPVVPSWDGFSEAYLLLAARSGDPEAATSLITSHARDIADTGISAEVCPSTLDLLLAGGATGTLPLRVRMLLDRLGRAEPGDDPTWKAYRSLPSAWQLVMWHWQVEGETIAQVGRRTALDESEVRKAALSASRALRQAILSGATPEDDACDNLVSSLRESVSGRLSSVQLSSVHSHCVYCDACLSWATPLLVTEFDLREHLADLVLGDRATQYLSRRPLPFALESTPAAPRASIRTARTIMATAGLGALVAAALAPLANPDLAVLPHRWGALPSHISAGPIIEPEASEMIVVASVTATTDVRPNPASTLLAQEDVGAPLGVAGGSLQGTDGQVSGADGAADPDDELESPDDDSPEDGSTDPSETATPATSDGPGLPSGVTEPGLTVPSSPEVDVDDDAVTVDPGGDGNVVVIPLPGDSSLVDEVLEGDLPAGDNGPANVEVVLPSLVVGSPLPPALG